MKAEVLKFYIDRETIAGKIPDKENIRVINLCENWRMNQNLTDDEINGLVIVECSASTPLTVNGRLLKDVALEANKQLDSEWRAGWDSEWIKKLMLKFETEEIDPIILRTKVLGEPTDGSYYVQDGNHRIVAAGIYFLKTGKFPKLNFHIGETTKI